MKQKYGAGHLEAWVRAGAKEVTQVLTAFPGHAIQPVEEPGLLGNPTQMDVNREKGNMQSYNQWLQARTPPAATEKPPPQLDRGL